MFILFRIDIPVSKQWRPWSDAAFCGVWSGLHCLPMSQKWDARLIWVNHYCPWTGSIKRDCIAMVSCTIFLLPLDPFFQTLVSLTAAGVKCRVVSLTFERSPQTSSQYSLYLLFLLDQWPHEAVLFFWKSKVKMFIQLKLLNILGTMTQSTEATQIMQHKTSIFATRI